MGLRSSDTAGHLIILISLFSNHLSVYLNQCDGVLSYMNIQFWFDESNMFSISNDNASSITLTYVLPLSLPEYMTNGPLVPPAIQFHTLTQLPSPCTFGTKLKG